MFWPGPFSGSASSLAINVYYFEPNGLPSPVRSNPITINAGQTIGFQPAAQCTLGHGSHYGMLGLQDASTQKTNYFFAFDCTQSITTQQGLSHRRIPSRRFSGQKAHTSSLKRVAAALGFATNCFVGSSGEPVDYTIEVHASDGTLLGTPIIGSLGPAQLFRYLDIFTAVGARQRKRFVATSTRQ